MKNQKNTATPSIGNIGLTVDLINNRVKILSNKVFESIIEIKNYLISVLKETDGALELLLDSKVRLTIRVIGKKLEKIEQISLFENISVFEEARIETSIGLDVIYLSFNGLDRFNLVQLIQEKTLSKESLQSVIFVPEPQNVLFERLNKPTSKDILELLEMYRLCFTDYLVPFNKDLVINASKGAIFYVARNPEGRIISSAIGESLKVGPFTFLEISEVATHPIYRVKGAASGCVRRVIKSGRQSIKEPLVIFWEARMWRNVLGISNIVGLKNFGGVLHQHCRIASPKEFTSIKQTVYGSLAVFYG